MVLSGIPQVHGRCLYCLLLSVFFFFFLAPGYYFLFFACFILFTGHTGVCPYTGCLFLIGIGVQRWLDVLLSFYYSCFSSPSFPPNCLFNTIILSLRWFGESKTLYSPGFDPT